MYKLINNIRKFIPISRANLFRIKDFLFNNLSTTEEVNNFLSLIKPVKTNHPLIRLGGDADGGYLVPDDLVGITTCFSPGVSSIAYFEEDLIKRGIQCFLADYSVEAPPIQHELIHFQKKYLGTIENNQFMTLENWVNRHASNDSELILQMDIEGHEYDIISATSEDTLKKFRIIILEGHYFYWLARQSHLPRIENAFKKLLKHFEIVHIHRNNCGEDVLYKNFKFPPHIEFTFLRKDRISYKEPIKEFPHELDKKNIPNIPDKPLPQCWYIHDDN